jgi:hypothetical protein
MDSPLDAAYELLQDFGPEYGLMAFANHGPMAVEAMVAFGRPDAALAWAARYARALEPMPPPRQPILDDQWSAALGDLARYRDWLECFDRQLAAAPWAAVIDTWSARLAPGLIGAALHGVLRAAHATRALAQADTPVRRHELAQGLAYWAATFHRLPGDPCSSAVGRPVDAALRAVPFLPAGQRRLGGSIVDALGPLDTFPPFRAAANLVDVAAASPAEILSDLTAAFAASYLANATRATLIAFIHFVTGPSAVRLLLPHVSERTARQLLAYAWQAGVALYCVYATTPAGRPAPSALRSRDELIDRAVATQDEHAVKFVEACLREEAARPEPVFRAAAANALDQIAANR